MKSVEFQSFHPSLDASKTVMIDGYAPGFRMISHWPGHATPEALRHDLTTGSCLKFVEMTQSAQRDLLGEFSVVTNNHYDGDGILSLYTVLEPEIALQHADLMLRAARSGDFAVWGGPEALALELSIMSDLAEFMPFTTPPYDSERLGNLSKAYKRVFGRLKDLLKNPFAMQSEWETRYQQVVQDIERVEAGKDIEVTKFPAADLAVVEIDVASPITIFGLRHAAKDLFRILLVHRADSGNRYRFCYRGESWWDVVSAQPHPRKPLEAVTQRLNELEQNQEARWWSTPLDWAVPEFGFGVPVTFQHQGVRIDPLTARDPASSLDLDVVLAALELIG